LTLRAADLAERGADDRGLEASMAKLYASEAAVENALEGIQIHGGYGYTTEYDVERYLRDAKLLTIGEGTNEIHRDIIADRVFEAT
jgi:alkylation response protein AidB-like acyl-CoA dehydrogenase